MLLRTLAHNLTDKTCVLANAGKHDVDITGLAYDSRLVKPGALFCCIPGFAVDGHQFARQAVENGATALLVERKLELSIPQLIVRSPRCAMAELAAIYFGQPTRKLQVIGVTGTNGKTTTSFLIRSILEHAGLQTGLLGTVASIVAGKTQPAGRTTPEAIDLQKTFHAMVAGGDQFCAMEVSSHALELERVHATCFATTIFTNLTQDHLDFHPTMEAYYQAKRKLFCMNPKTAVVVIDDDYGKRLTRELKQLGQPVLTVSLDQAEADLIPEAIDFTPVGSSFTLDKTRFSVPLPGAFNAVNALCAIAAVRSTGLDDAVIARGLAAVSQVPGRFQRISLGQPFTVIIDYAHTPDSLDNVLATARTFTTGRLICLFGCGGDRDKAKRPLMAAAACRHADHVLITSDNPRSEDPELIIRQILKGVDASVHCETVVDRSQAIERAISLAREGDTVVLAGKGHEQGQEFADKRVIPFDDATVATQALQKYSLTTELAR